MCGGCTNAKWSLHHLRCLGTRQSVNKWRYWPPNTSKRRLHKVKVHQWMPNGPFIATDQEVELTATGVAARQRCTTFARIRWNLWLGFCAMQLIGEEESGTQEKTETTETRGIHWRRQEEKRQSWAKETGCKAMKRYTTFQQVLKSLVYHI